MMVCLCCYRYKAENNQTRLYDMVCNVAQCEAEDYVPITELNPFISLFHMQLSLSLYTGAVVSRPKLPFQLI